MDKTSKISRIEKSIGSSRGLLALVIGLGANPRVKRRNWLITGTESDQKKPIQFEANRKWTDTRAGRVSANRYRPPPHTRQPPPAGWPASQPVLEKNTRTLTHLCTCT
ncbi:hypothetical protein Y032_0045g1121 [Ancylostoma ceylanicum]|uniref:Uncharacterized protein n=1 Tax=Ancylostoma ceylanicum TaxID=53326 RepID=A0A016UE00_9BILA|nr:hypothetical protein Y032_0045g1121 [Ancylostoma ceylanicum]